ncbi:hypothetical protein PAEPH01_0128 [Pancytospora epiphaga]|nr:hypothetical protein PAEPH01_0128 [Pancytospora epiphaga]
MLFIDEIESLIDQFPEKHRKTLSEFYIEKSKEKFKEPTPIKRSRISLLRSNLKYIDEKKQKAYVEEIIGLKVLQTRALILDIAGTNYTIDKEHIYKPESWIDLVLVDISETFELPEDIDLFEAYNRQLCSELLLIFCSCKNFRSSGNQLILNIVYYKDNVKGDINYDFDGLIKKLASRFEKETYWGIDKINEIYNEYLKKTGGLLGRKFY